MRRRLVVAPLAAVDLSEIGKYLAAEVGAAAAKAFAAELGAKIEWIARSGTFGVARDHIRPGLRGLIFKERCIYFRIVGDECRIERIVHTRREIGGMKFAGDAET